MAISISFDDNMIVTGYAIVGEMEGGVSVEEDKIPTSMLSDFRVGKYLLDYGKLEVTEVVGFNEGDDYDSVIEVPNDLEVMKQLVASQAMVMALQNNQLETKTTELSAVKRQLGMMAMTIAEITTQTGEGED